VLDVKSVIVEAVVEAIKKAVIYLPPDVKDVLKKVYVEEDNSIARVHLNVILKNIELAEKLGVPVCQDTGLLVFYVKLGARFPWIEVVEESLVEATKIATKVIPLRPNTVNPFTGFNPGDNTGRYTPVIIWDSVDPGNDVLEVTVVPKGGGSEYVSTLRIIPPGEGFEKIKEVVLDAVIDAGAKPCPPVIIGVGIAGLADQAMYLAKKAATIRRIGSRHPEPAVADLEVELLRTINSLGIGAMGMGGKIYALDVHIEYAYRHPATYAIAIAFQCWAARRAKAIVKPDGSYVVEQ